MLLRTTPAALVLFFFFNDTATTEIYTLSLHDALPISRSYTAITGRTWPTGGTSSSNKSVDRAATYEGAFTGTPGTRSEEHTSELQSQSNLVCRLLLEKKKNHCRIYTDLSRRTLTIYRC